MHSHGVCGYGTMFVSRVVLVLVLVLAFAGGAAAVQQQAGTVCPPPPECNNVTNAATISCMKSFIKPQVRLNSHPGHLRP